MNHLTIDQIFDIIDGEIPANERVILQEHIDSCGECQAELTINQSLTRAAQKSSLVVIDEFQVSKIMNLVMNEPLEKSILVPALHIQIASTPKRKSIYGVPLTRLVWFAIVASFLSFLASLPHGPESRVPNPRFQNVISMYTNWLQVFTHKVVDFFEPLTSIIPFKTSSSLVMFLIVGVLLWLLDRSFQKRFRIRG